MKLVLMGTGPFAVPAFDALAGDEGHEVLAVVTKPSTPTGKLKKGVTNPVYDWAVARNIARKDGSQEFLILQPTSVNDARAIDVIRDLHADLFVVCDYGFILSKQVLAASRLGGVNLHGSLLPRHRGAAPVQWSILRGDHQAGVSVIHMTPRLDAGPLIRIASTPIGTHENAFELETRLSELGVEPTCKAIQQIAECATIDDVGSLGAIQDASLVTKAPRLEKQHAVMDFREAASLLHRQVRGLQPWPGAFANLNIPDKPTLRVAMAKVRVLEMPTDLPHGTLVWGDDLVKRATSHSFALPEDGGELAVACGQQWLGIDQLQPAGKRRMKAGDFLRGYARHSTLHFEIPQKANPIYEMMKSP